MLERSEQQIRAASSLEELLQVAHSEDWKLWRCRLKLKSLASVDSRATSHRSTRFAATFYDTETLKGRCVSKMADSFLLRQWLRYQLLPKVWIGWVCGYGQDRSLDRVENGSQIATRMFLHK